MTKPAVPRHLRPSLIIPAGTLFAMVVFEYQMISVRPGNWLTWAAAAIVVAVWPVTVWLYGKTSWQRGQQSVFEDFEQQWAAHHADNIVREIEEGNGHGG